MTGIPKSVQTLPSAHRVFVALDTPDAPSALALVRKLAPLGVGFKIGMQLFYAEGMSIVRAVQAQSDCPVFVDLKLHDIPNTVSGAVTSLVRQGVRFLNVHCQGGPEMMRAAAETAKTIGGAEVTVIGVTVLTSLSEANLRDFLQVEGISLAAYVTHLAKQAQSAGLDGVVCSAQEAPILKAACGPDFLLVTPGIRPAGKDTQDQSRIATPRQALEAGSDYLVIGRPISEAVDPVLATQDILKEIEQVILPKTEVLQE